MEYEVEFFVSLERQVWEALRLGDGEADGRLLSDDFFGVYESGFADRAEHVEQLADGPTVSEYEMQSPRLAVLAPGMAMLSYRAVFRPAAGAVGADLAPAAAACAAAPAAPARERERLETCYVTSIWEERDGRWVNTFSQDTRGVGG